jgi:hypothetical protein
MTVFVLLVVLAMLLAVVSLIKPQWPLVAVAVILICIALLIQRGGSI